MPIDGAIIGEATDHDSLVALLRQRKATLALSDTLVDELAGLCAGHTSKVIGSAPVRSLGKVTLSALLAVLGIKLVAVEDPEQTARIGRRWQRRSEKHVRPATYSLNQARPLVLARAARKAVLARWAGTSGDERKAISAMLHAAKARKKAVRTRTQTAA